MTPARCSFPNCVLEEHLEGDHKFGRPEKPWGSLRQAQLFDAVLTSGGPIHCDYCWPERGYTLRADSARVYAWRAVGFYIDMLGFGWALCAECARKFTAEIATAAKEEPETHPARKEEKPGKPLVTATSSASFATSAVEPPGKLLKFARRKA